MSLKRELLAPTALILTTAAMIAGQTPDVPGRDRMIGCPVLSEPDVAARRALMAFDGKIGDYIAIRRRAEAVSPPIRVSSDVHDIVATSHALAEAIRKSRKHAREGDVITSDTAALFRRRINDPRTAGRSPAQLLAEINEDDETPSQPARLSVNASFDWAYASAMPVCVLAALPSLPQELAYRFVGSDLVMLDIDADLIVDVLRGAISAH